MNPSAADLQTPSAPVVEDIALTSNSVSFAIQFGQALEASKPGH